MARSADRGRSDSIARVGSDSIGGARAAVPPYFPVRIDSGASLRRLVNALGPARLTTFLKLNRVDLAHVRAEDTLVLPADSGRNAEATAPFPRRVLALDSVPKLIVVSLRIQAFAAYESGRLVRWGPTSTGKHSTPTPTGLFHANWKAREARSTINGEWVLPWYVNIESERGISLHQYGLPGRPASHACVRLLEEDAKWIWDWVEQWRLDRTGQRIVRYGTPVVILGAYQYGKRAPWRRLVEDPAATTVRPGELDSVLANPLPVILSRR